MHVAQTFAAISRPARHNLLARILWFLDSSEDHILEHLSPKVDPSTTQATRASACVHVMFGMPIKLISANSFLRLLSSSHRTIRYEYS